MGAVGGTVIEAIRDSAGFESLREEWNELLRASTSDCVFLTWEWLRTWWKYLSGGRQLRVITVRCGGELIAIAPLAVRPPRPSRLVLLPALEFLGSGIIGSDYLDLIVRRGAEQEACRALAAYLGGEHGMPMLELTQLKRGASLMEPLAAELRQLGWSPVESRTNVCPYIALAGHTWRSYLATLGSSHCTNFERRVKTLMKKFEVRLERVVFEEQRPQALARLVVLHNKRWHGRGVSEAFDSPALLSFHDEISRLALERGWLRLFTLKLDGVPAAALYGFRYGHVFNFFQSGFDPCYAKHSVGLVLLGLTIKSALEEDVAQYDLLHGDEAYKFLWTSTARALGRMELYPPGMRGRVYEGAHVMGRVARKLARRVLPGRLADQLAAGGWAGIAGGRHASRTR